MSSAAGELADPATGRGRAGERHAGDVGVGDERLADVGATEDDWSSPSGSPASRKTASNTAPPQTAVWGSGLRMTALPRASAGATTRIPSTVGEFQGVIAPTTPAGTRRSIDSRPGTRSARAEP